MSQRQYIALIGIAIIILPFLGFPMLLKQILFVFIGLFVIFYAFRVMSTAHTSADTFSDSQNHTA